MLDFSAFDKNDNIEVNIFGTEMKLKTIHGILTVLFIVFIVSGPLSVVLQINIASYVWLLYVLGILFAGPNISKAMKQVHEKRLQNFSQDNNFKYSQRDLAFSEGALFRSYPKFQDIKNVISGTIGGNPFRVFSFRVEEGSGRNKRIIDNGVAEITLPIKFPHIILDNKINPAINSSHAKKSQRIKLGGLFDEQYTIYGPQEYEIEVLQVLNPQLLEQLSKKKYAIDFEFIDNKLYLYSEDIKTKNAVIAMFSAIELINTVTLKTQKTLKFADNIGTYQPVLKKRNLSAFNIIGKIINAVIIIAIIWFGILPIVRQLVELL